MSVAENKAIVRQVLEEALNQGKLELVDRLFTPDFVDHSTPAQSIGPTGVKAFFSKVRASFPDIHVNIDDIIAEGSNVVVRTTWYGTSHSLGSVSGTLIQIFRLENGRIKEEWNEGTALSLYA